mgnify:CR=1 FL=1
MFANELQASPLNSLVAHDFNGGGQIQDLLLAGNNLRAETETTRSYGDVGLLLKGGRGCRISF